jgi:hypothetical protein
VKRAVVQLVLMLVLAGSLAGPLLMLRLPIEAEVA